MEMNHCRLFQNGIASDVSSETGEYENIFFTQTSPKAVSPFRSSSVGVAACLRVGLLENATNLIPFTDSIFETTIEEKEHEEEIFFGLPVTVKDLLLKHRGIEELYDWQKECLSMKAVQERENLVFTLPTSGGKTLVAEVLLLKEMICRNKNALFVLPFISIVQEKVRSLAPLALELGFLIEEYAGNKGHFPPRKRRKKHSLFIATIEKSHMMINSLLEHHRIHEIGLIVVDELHMLFEGADRGSDLEILLTKLRLFSEVHIVGMSATISNIQDIKKFLNAQVYKRDFRPVELKEYIKIEDKLWSIDYHGMEDFNLMYSRSVPHEKKQELSAIDPDQILSLVCEILPDNSCLVFCPTKKQCQNLSMMICKNLNRDFLRVRMEERNSLLTALEAEVGAGGVCPILRKTIPFGIAYHHSGLTMDERKLIEEAYSYGTLCMLTCTSTLAAGVNLPAKRVIVRAPFVGTCFISPSQYKQMVGRAGRAGLDSSGESILILKSAEINKLKEILSIPEDNCCSSLFSSGRSNLTSFILSIVGLQLGDSQEELIEHVKKTLYGIQNPLENVSKAVEGVVDKLLQLRLLSRSGKNKKLVVTSLGTAVMRSGIETSLCSVLQKHLRSALECISLLSQLHLLFLVTPYDFQENLLIDPHVYYSVYMMLSSGDQKTAALIGISEASVTHLMAGRNLGKNVDKDILRRFYLTLALYEIWQQKPLSEVAIKFKSHKGTIHNLLTRTAGFASSVMRFTQELNEFWALADLLPGFVKQLQFCCQKELLPLMGIPAVKQGRARQLYEAGYKTLVDVAKADPRQLSKNIDHLPKKIAYQIISAAKMLLFEEAENLQDEAANLVEDLKSPDLGKSHDDGS